MVSSCKTLTEKLTPVDICRYKPSISPKPICSKYKYWVKGGETIGEDFESQLPTDFWYLDNTNFKSILNDRDLIVIWASKRTWKIKKRKNRK